METLLITGSNGEIGHGLIPFLYKKGYKKIFAIDKNKTDENLRKYIEESFVLDIRDSETVKSLIEKISPSAIFHLAAILSTSSEKDPEMAISVNSRGTENLLKIANNLAQKRKTTIKFIFPSTIAVYGLPDLETKKKVGSVKENQFLEPITIYGITKLYSEKIGIYFSQNYKLLSSDSPRYLDFRCIRFPGIISALTLPTGGTSDYAPEMIHSAAKGEGYESFVRPDTKIPFMVMPDAVKALISIFEAPKGKLKNKIYNVQSFSITAKEISELINETFPDSSISYNPDPQRQRIVDSWPESIDDSLARTDWGWQPDFDLIKSFKDYLIPEIRKRYS